jgi:hypothetical protein
MVDSFKISQPVRSVRFQEIMGCFNFGFWVMDFGFIQNSGLVGLAGLGQEETQSSVFSFQFGRRGSQTFILECGIMRSEKRFSVRIKHQQTRDFFMYSHCVDLISRLLVTSNWWRVEDDVECWILDWQMKNHFNES